ncbi:unnamed protein product [Ostreobium quekettii]|uniref:DNA-directed RNA polymerase subunit n=1 Tax=Ostreobium quekettii TaxID=121088 RepID=A0A8S1IYV1_9CHLO|nr:unnamed protein product [Ostreobium quekettii]
MSAIPSKEITTAHVAGVRFGLYTDDEIRKLSVKELTCPIVWDNLRNPVSGGVYDLALGPLESLGACATCGLSYHGCPGHFGHINLPVPVYNPILFGFLYRILKCVCLHCFQFKMPAVEVSKFAKRLRLLHQGSLMEALAVDVQKSVKEFSKSPNFKGGGDSVEKLANGGIGDQPQRLESLSSHVIDAIQTTLGEFVSRMTTKAHCENCGAQNPIARKEPGLRVFLNSLTNAQIMKNHRNGTVLVSIVGSGLIAQGKNGMPQYLTPLEVREILRKLWIKEATILEFICKATRGMVASEGQGPCGYRSLFLQVVPVPPNKFRPASYENGVPFEHAHNVFYTRIISCCHDLMALGEAKDESNIEDVEVFRMTGLRQGMSLWARLQEAVNNLMDSTTAPAKGLGDRATPGIRQVLEKKEGLFRKHMMGKRVNFAARSTISPDPCLGVGEIGIPPYFAKKLSFPERVTPWNVEELRRLVVRGASEPGGAVAVEDEKGRLISLQKMPRWRREAIAKSLLLVESTDSSTIRSSMGSDRGRGQGLRRTQSKIVYRQVKDGDLMLTNRQPTLHKPGLMAHRVRVLHGERTIRFHYANCKTFNADFDGDEINLHLPQDHLCRAEGYGIVHADHQYIVPTDGKPLRGLIQDSIDAGVLLTKRDTFLRRHEYMQLVYVGLAANKRCTDVCVQKEEQDNFGMGGQLDEPNGADEGDLEFEPPTIWKPAALWSGKQAISTVLTNLVKGLPPITTSGKGTVPAEYWGDKDEGGFVFHKGYYVFGVMDKAQYGTFGLIHACQELYGNQLAGRLLSALGRLFVFFLQERGFTCGLADTQLLAKAESERQELLNGAEWKALAASANVIGAEVPEERPKSRKRQGAMVASVAKALASKYRENADTGKVHDSNVTGPMHQVSSAVVKQCLPHGIVKPFLHNSLTTMTIAGAKGSFVNFSQIACLLGQQELEGRRVPRMTSGKTLPCFAAFDPGARSGGFVGDRFLTGLRPQEYYFHCMAGREGLVDTSVKTANSGYLQRCMIKSMESLRVQYEYSVRDDSDGSIVQFQYGEDALDVTSIPYLKNFAFMANNCERIKQQLRVDEAKAAGQAFGLSDVEREIRRTAKNRRQRLRGAGCRDGAAAGAEQLPLMSIHPPSIMGVTSEAFDKGVSDFLEDDPCGAWKEDGKCAVTKKEFEQLMQLKYMQSLIPPGEAIGVIAAQSIGEPSTQMTLNTFHMAGRGEANVTLGIPRLREVLMTASKAVKTPVMTMPLKAGARANDGRVLANRLRRIKMAECLKSLKLQTGVETPAF